MATRECITEGCRRHKYRTAPYCKTHADEVLDAIIVRMILEGKLEFGSVDEDGQIHYRSLIYKGPEEPEHGQSG